MSLCDFSAFLRIPFSESDFLHYILKYVFEPFESRLLGVSLQKVPKKQRLRFQGLCRFPFTKSDYKLVGIPIPLGREVFCLPFTHSGSSYHRRGLS